MFDFKELINTFKEDSLMNTIINEFSLMIEDGRWMFEEIGESLLRGDSPENHKQELYDRDLRLNKTERSIRKKVVEHITLNPRNDLSTCLVMFSAAKDAERLGDYCKNLLEVSMLMNGRRYPDSIFPHIKSTHQMISQFFTRTAKAFSDVDTEDAHKIMEAIRSLTHECDGHIKEINESQEIMKNYEVVTSVLTFRYFKRVAAHISNIASGIINPAHKIDYFGKETDN